jgi:hypothetical protein
MFLLAVNVADRLFNREKNTSRIETASWPGCWRTLWGAAGDMMPLLSYCQLLCDMLPLPRYCQLLCDMLPLLSYCQLLCDMLPLLSNCQLLCDMLPLLSYCYLLCVTVEAETYIFNSSRRGGFSWTSSSGFSPLARLDESHHEDGMINIVVWVCVHLMTAVAAVNVWWWSTYPQLQRIFQRQSAPWSLRPEPAKWESECM